MADQAPSKRFTRSGVEITDTQTGKTAQTHSETGAEALLTALNRGKLDAAKLNWRDAR